MRPQLIFSGSAATYPILAAILISGAPGRAHNFSEKNVELNSSSGYVITGVHYVLKNEPGPAVLLIHDIGGDHTQWNGFLEILERAGFCSILAPDLRGHGESRLRLKPENVATDSDKVSWRDFSEEDLRHVIDDFQVAWDYLKASGATDTTRMAVMGSVAGANYAAVFSAENRDVKSLVLLSPGVVYRGIGCLKAIQAYGARPVLFSASKEDRYSAGSCKKLKESSEGTPAHMEVLEGSGRGVNLIDNNPGFKHFLSDWFRSTL